MSDDEGPEAVLRVMQYGQELMRELAKNALAGGSLRPAEVSELDQFRAKASELLDSLINGAIEHIEEDKNCTEPCCPGGATMVLMISLRENMQKLFMAAMFTAVYRLAEQKRQEVASGK